MMPSPIGNNAKLKDIAKMTIDIKLFDFRISRSMGEHGAISGFVGIIRFIKILSFRIRLELLMILLAYFGLYSVTNASMPEESKMVVSAFATSIA